MKIARGRELLTPEQRQALMQIPEDEWVLGTYYTFSKRDLEIINKRRREENRLGFAVQLAVLRYPGWSYTHIKSILDSVIHYISKQIGATPSLLSLYPQRENTLWDHLKEIRSEYDFVTFTLKEYRMVFKHLHQSALENGDAVHLLHECIDFLRKNKIILSAITTLERMMWEARAMAEKKLFNTVSESLTNDQKEKFDGVGKTGSDGTKLTEEDCATKQSIDIPPKGTEISVRNLEKNIVGTVYKYTVGTLPDAIVDIMPNKMSFYYKTPIGTYPYPYGSFNGRYYHTR